MKVGDVVKLKSGGPEMTVVRAQQRGNGESAVDAVYMVGDGKLEVLTNMPVLALEMARPEPEPEVRGPAPAAKPGPAKAR